VPRLADQGIYLASESTFYRILKAAQPLKHRRSERPSHAPSPKRSVLPRRISSIAGTSPICRRRSKASSTISTCSSTSLAVRSSAGKCLKKRAVFRPASCCRIFIDAKT
jgi:hypothetical protein